MLVVCILLSTSLGFTGAMLYTKMKVADAEISDNGAMIINKVDIDEQTAQKLSDKPTSQITEEVADTVVEITTEVMSTNSFYGQYISQGAGSGVIISSDGYIVTNNHVINGATSITVTLRDKTTYEAELVGTDSIVDVALLKIDAKNLKAATFGDSDKLKVGDKAVAIGNPLGQLGGTVTDGIISALDRDVVIDGETMNLLQTDTAINPGNSGGGLFDGQGALVGVVVAKSSGEEIEGLGFAIPINDVIDILDDLKEHGYVRGRVAMGVQLIDLTNEMYAMYYYGNAEAGCYVYSVEFDSAAYKAGIQQGDRIVSVDGKKISTSSEVEEALEGKKVGDKVKLELERGSKTATIELELGEYIPEKNAQVQQNQNDIFNPFG
ncbi:MAG: trypsin-like peptidase domain-containing protein [Ruminococcus sp.]|nr:trypsin-like peptidase domain-containing protein [Ruminococcus sp.]